MYVRDDASQEVFLIDDSKLRNLRQARTTLPNRAIFSRSPKEAVSTVLQWEDKTLELKHQNAQDTKNAVWVYAEKPDTDATQIETWLSKALRICLTLSQSRRNISNMIPQLILTWADGIESKTTYAMLTNDEDISWWVSNPSTRVGMFVFLVKLWQHCLRTCPPCLKNKISKKAFPNDIGTLQFL